MTLTIDYLARHHEFVPELARWHHEQWSYIAPEVELSQREVDILALLVRERGRIVSRRALLQQVWGMAAAARVETRTVDMHVAKLRKKIGASPIETVRGEGYRFED